MLQSSRGILRRILAPWTKAARSAEVGPACKAAHRYDDLVRTQRYGEIAPLFAPDAVWFMPTGKVAHGRDEIGRSFQSYLGDRRPIFRTDNYVDGGLFCVMEVSMKVRVDVDGKVALGPDGMAVIIPDGSSEDGIFVRRAIDHFTVDERGLVTRMIVYNAPTTYWR